MTATEAMVVGNRMSSAVLLRCACRSCPARAGGHWGAPSGSSFVLESSHPPNVSAHRSRWRPRGRGCSGGVSLALLRGGPLANFRTT
jgi:hypothetical protein